MKRTIVTVFISILLGVALAVALPIFAHPPGESYRCGAGSHPSAFGPHGDPEARIERLTEQLDLTKEQRDAMRAIIDQARPQMRALHDKLLDNRKQLWALMQGTPDESQLRTLADAQGKTIADLIVWRTNMHLKIGKVLTDQQREQLHQLRRGQAPRDS
jgi:Spy/CpxP family protein refolding chaperone